MGSHEVSEALVSKRATREAAVGGIVPGDVATAVTAGGGTGEQLLLYVLGEKLQLKVGEGNFPRVLPLLKILLQHFLVISSGSSSRWRLGFV